jgi:hypothetical protein
MLCATAAPVGTCQGDSGGPLLQTSAAGGQPLLLALPAFGPAGCAWDGNVSGFTRVACHAPWLLQRLPLALPPPGLGGGGALGAPPAQLYNQAILLQPLRVDLDPPGLALQRPAPPPNGSALCASASAAQAGLLSPAALFSATCVVAAVDLDVTLALFGVPYAAWASAASTAPGWAAFSGGLASALGGEAAAFLRARGLGGLNSTSLGCVFSANASAFTAVTRTSAPAPISAVTGGAASLAPDPGDALLLPVRFAGLASPAAAAALLGALAARAGRPADAALPLNCSATLAALTAAFPGRPAPLAIGWPAGETAAWLPARAAASVLLSTTLAPDLSAAAVAAAAAALSAADYAAALAAAGLSAVAGALTVVPPLYEAPPAPPVAPQPPPPRAAAELAARKQFPALALGLGLGLGAPGLLLLLRCALVPLRSRAADAADAAQRERLHYDTMASLTELKRRGALDLVPITQASAPPLVSMRALRARPELRAVPDAALHTAAISMGLLPDPGRPAGVLPLLPPPLPRPMTTMMEDSSGPETLPQNMRRIPTSAARIDWGGVISPHGQGVPPTRLESVLSQTQTRPSRPVAELALTLTSSAAASVSGEAAMRDQSDDSGGKGYDGVLRV